MVSTGTSSVACVIMLLSASFFPPLVVASRLRFTMPVRMATTGHPSRTRTATTRGTFISIRTVASQTMATAISVYLFVPSKGSLNSERSERRKFFNSLILSTLEEENGSVRGGKMMAGVTYIVIQ